MDLAKLTYSVSAALPQHEKFGLSSQIQRAAVSIPSNIAEGSKRSSRADFRQFCKVALGSAAELETQLLLIEQLYPETPVRQALEQTVEVQKMLTSLQKRLSENYKL